VDRLKWAGLFAVLNDFVLNEERLTFKILAILSGIWHFDRGDCHYKEFAWSCIGRGVRSEHIEDTIHNLASYHLRAGAGVGMLWVALGIYPLRAFIVMLILFVACQFYIRFWLGGIRSIRIR